MATLFLCLRRYTIDRIDRRIVLPFGALVLDVVALDTYGGRFTQDRRDIENSR